MTKLQKVGFAVVAFCLTVAVTRRVQQEVDKEAFQNTPSDEPRVGYWLYEDQLPDGTYGFAHHGPKGVTFWAAKIVKTEYTLDNLDRDTSSFDKLNTLQDKQTGTSNDAWSQLPLAKDNPFSALILRPQKIAGKDFTDFNVWTDELVVHQEHGPTQHLKIVRRVR
jgi:hypothetical protein